MSDQAWISLFTNMAGILTALGTLYAVLKASRRQKRMHKQMNGRLKRLVRVSQGKAFAEGKLDAIVHPPAPPLMPVLVPPVPPAPPAAGPEK